MNKVKDQSNDHKYFVSVPQIVWAKVKDTYELTLWLVIKMIAGEKGECYLSTPDLATATMMSAGKVSQCRLSLIESGLLKGQVRKDPGYPQPVWHLTIPDLWPENIAWRQTCHSLKERIEIKKEQRKRFHPMKAKEPSPGERGLSPDEGGTSPGETKKNHIEPKGIPKVETRVSTPTATPPFPLPEKQEPLAEKKGRTAKKKVLRSELVPDTDQSLEMFEKLRANSARKGRRGPKYFPTKECKEKFDLAAESLGSEFGTALNKALEQGIVSMVGVTNYVAKWAANSRKSGHISVGA